MGVDSNEGVEIAGPSGTDLTGWSLVLYDGVTGAVYTTTFLGGVIDDEENGFGAIFFYYPPNGLQNGAPDGLALVSPLSQVIQFLSYEGVIVATDGPAIGLTSVDIGVYEDSTTPDTHSLQLYGTGSIASDFSWQGPLANTFDCKNTNQTFIPIHHRLYCPVIFR